MRLIECSECAVQFDLDSTAKRTAGGKRNHCPDCAEEDAVKYAGVASGDGKMASVSILKFQSPEDRKGFIKFWRAASGVNVGKSCQLSNSTPAMTSGARFTRVAEFVGNSNHKGKM
jgi:hypothetical protein